MFIKFQIPSDLVSYDGPEENSKENKVAKVKEYVGRMTAMVESTKKEQLDNAQQEQKMRLADFTGFTYQEEASASESDGDYDEDDDDQSEEEERAPVKQKKSGVSFGFSLGDGGKGGRGGAIGGRAPAVTRNTSSHALVKPGSRSGSVAGPSTSTTSSLSPAQLTQNQNQNKPLEQSMFPFHSPFVFISIVFRFICLMKIF